MRATLPQRSLVIKDKLDSIVQEILSIADKKIAMIILFGSYARGDWVHDKYVKGHITYTYESDIDMLIVLSKGKYAGHRALDLEHKILRSLENKGLLLSGVIGELEPSLTLVLESINYVNEKLEQGHYFFTDVKKEGILLYNSHEFELLEAKELTWKERQEIARKYYKQWFRSGYEFLQNAQWSYEQEYLNKSAFLLHQATESFYNTILLVFSGYKPKLHDILKLGKIARSYNQELYWVFPWETDEQKKCFKLLLNAYVDARYNENYIITQEQLLYLIERVESLKNLTEKICTERLDNNYCSNPQNGE